MSRAEFDTSKAEAFEEKLTAALNGGALALMTSLGHRTGLFDGMRGLEPSTSETIAERTGLRERYVREWLGAMVTSGVVEYDPARHTYQLPDEHAASLTRAASPSNFGVTFQWIPVLASIEDELVGCFKQGGGVGYSSYDRFHAVMAEESDQTVVAVLLEAILPSLPGITEDLESGIEVLDVGCGSGRALNLMAARFPKSRFFGFDFSEEGLTTARKQAESEGLANVQFEVRDMAQLDQPERFDLITAFDAIHDQAEPDAVLRGIYRALKPGRSFLMQDIAGSSHVDQDIDHPIGTFLYTISCMHCMTVSLADEGAGLGAMWGKEVACRMLEEAGFSDVEVKSLPHDPINYYYTARKKG